jgi:hypothetical protein
MTTPGIEVVLEAVLVSVADNEPCILTVKDSGTGSDGTLPGLPSGALDISADRTLDRGLRRWVHEQSGIDVGYVEQLYTFGDQFRYPGERGGGPRTLSVAYLALIGEEPPSASASWQAWYDFLPWEDHRGGVPDVIGTTILPALTSWMAVASDPDEAALRAERSAVSFGLGETPWNPVRVLERYELLYDVGLIAESGGGKRGGASEHPLPGKPMMLDHRRIAATALARLRGKLSYRPVVFELLPDRFTLLALQQLVEALAGVLLHKQNFRRLVERGGLVEGTGRHTPTGGRPAELYRFRREVLIERPRPGVGFPASSS